MTGCIAAALFEALFIGAGASSPDVAGAGPGYVLIRDRATEQVVRVEDRGAQWCVVHSN